MQESLVDLNDPVPKTNVFTIESQGINREAIIPDTRGLQGEIVREGPIVTPRTQLPTTERLALPAEGEVVPEQIQEQIELPNKVKVNIIAPDQETANLVRQKIEEGPVSRPYKPKTMMQLSEENFVNKYGITPDEARNRFLKQKKLTQEKLGKLPMEDQKRLYEEYDLFRERLAKPTIPRPMRGKAGEAGFIVSDVQEGAAKVAQKWLTTEGNLPKEMFDIMEAKGSRTQAMLKQIDFTLKDLSNAARELNGKPKLTPDQSLQVDQFLRGYLPAENLPQAIRPVAQQMRRQLDNLSEGLIQVGAFSQEPGPSGMSKADIIRMNKGEYLTRSYEKFDNPKYDVKLVRQRNPAL
jgi:hypothetical protein